jgi:hypothetical protein
MRRSFNKIVITGLFLSLSLTLGNIPALAQPDIDVAVAITPTSTLMDGSPVKAVISFDYQGPELVTPISFLKRGFHLDLVFTDEKGREIRSNIIGQGSAPPAPVLLINGVLTQVDQVELVLADTWPFHIVINDINSFYTLPWPGRYTVKAVIPARTYPNVEHVTQSGEKFTEFKSANWAGVLVSDPPTRLDMIADGDGDGYSYPTAIDPPYDPLPDCDDSNASVNPGATEVLDNGIDDDCDPLTPDHVEPQPGTVNVEATLHVVGGGSKPDTGRFVLENMDLKLYDNTSACMNLVAGNWQTYPAIWKCPCPTDLRATTDSAGLASITAPPGSYLLMGTYLPATGSTMYVARNVGNLAEGGSILKKVQIMEKANGSKVPTKVTVRTGSELLIIEPEYVEWDGTEELYPFVFETVGDWEVTTSVEPPEGFVADHESLSEVVVSEVEAVQFIITDIGSKWVETGVTYEVTHKGKKEKIKSKIGIKCSPKLGKKKGFDEFCKSKK